MSRKLGNEIRKSVNISPELERLINQRLMAENRTFNDCVRMLLLEWVSKPYLANVGLDFLDLEAERIAEEKAKYFGDFETITTSGRGNSYGK